jgi:hypothetical protein
MTHQNNPKYAFYYLLSLAGLIFMAISVGIIAFQIIDKTVYDALSPNNNYSDGPLKFAISALLIATPIFYLISGLIAKGLRKEEISKESSLRRWMIYIIIFAASLIILGVFIGTINSFLAGELTWHFILKALTILIIATAVFSFYFYDVRRQDLKKTKVVKIFFWASLAIVVAAFVSSWFFVESPQTTRAKRLDQLVISNISNLQSAVNMYYERYQKLPADLAELTSDKNIYIDTKSLIDSENNQPINYRKIDDTNFEICATFRLIGDNNASSYVYVAPVTNYPNFNNHQAGYQCFNNQATSLIKPVK